MTLSGRGAVVTGGGRGIGAAVARSLAEAGAAVVVAARSTGEIEGVAGSLVQAGHEVWAVTCDVADEGSVARLRTEAERRLGRVDVLVNNAGIAVSGPVLHQSLEEWNRAFAVNATGTLLCMQAFLPGMVEAGWGRVVNVASVASLTAGKYIGAYAASKHAVMALTRAAAAELAIKGITVNAVCPGFVDTPMTDQSVARIMEKTGMSHDEALATILAMSPQNRLIEPDEVAHAVLSLCADGARGVNGQAIVVDGGGHRA